MQSKNKTLLCKTSSISLRIQTPSMTGYPGKGGPNFTKHSDMETKSNQGISTAESRSGHINAVL